MLETGIRIRDMEEELLQKQMERFMKETGKMMYSTK